MGIRFAKKNEEERMGVKVIRQPGDPVTRKTGNQVIRQKTLEKTEEGEFK
jgi:hypothetical protein